MFEESDSCEFALDNRGFLDTDDGDKDTFVIGTIKPRFDGHSKYLSNKCILRYVTMFL